MNNEAEHSHLERLFMGIREKRVGVGIEVVIRIKSINCCFFSVLFTEVTWMMVIPFQACSNQTLRCFVWAKLFPFSFFPHSLTTVGKWTYFSHPWHLTTQLITRTLWQTTAQLEMISFRHSSCALRGSTPASRRQLPSMWGEGHFSLCSLCSQTGLALESFDWNCPQTKLKAKIMPVSPGQMPKVAQQCMVSFF